MRSTARYLDQVFEEGTTPNGVFAAKLMWGYLYDFVGNLREIEAYRDMPVPELLATVFPDLRYIYVTRRDKVRQAVSLWKAIQNAVWGQLVAQAYLPLRAVSAILRNSLQDDPIQGVTDDSGPNPLVRTATRRLPG